MLQATVVHIQMDSLSWYQEAFWAVRAAVLRWQTIQLLSTWTPVHCEPRWTFVVSGEPRNSQAQLGLEIQSTLHFCAKYWSTVSTVMLHHLISHHMPTAFLLINEVKMSNSASATFMMSQPLTKMKLDSFVVTWFTHAVLRGTFQFVLKPYSKLKISHPFTVCSSLMSPQQF